MAAMTDTPTQPILRIRGISLAFGGNQVLKDVTFDAPTGEILALIGPNGAGKSSLLNVLTGVYTPDEGKVEVHTVSGEYRSLLEVPQHRLVEFGVARTFQNLQLVPELTALDNVLLGCHQQMKSGVLSTLVATPRSRREERHHRRVCMETLDYLGLGPMAGREVGKLPYGVNKRVELARALVARPRLLLLDEPAAGLNDEETEEMATVMRLIRAEGSCTQVLVEHDMNMVMSTADRLVVLNFGRLLTNGSPDEVRNHPEVMSAYLGTALDH
ncbi:ABC transporter ATP-binding protein [Spirillospora sp. NPDC048823]|uniref:ABC transporter ATP-binding protein n=2 Tax=Spirillospora TaxID=58122 RepID=UPI00371E8DCE